MQTQHATHACTEALACQVTATGPAVIIVDVHINMPTVATPTASLQALDSLHASALQH